MTQHQQGVKIKLLVRGICSLVSGKKDLSENIEGLSIVDRYLEHSRLYYFYHDGEENIFPLLCRLDGKKFTL